MNIKCSLYVTEGGTKQWMKNRIWSRVEGPSVIFESGQKYYNFERKSEKSNEVS